MVQVKSEELIGSLANLHELYVLSVSSADTATKPEASVKVKAFVFVLNVE